jgi:hypothetical protein
MEVRQYPEVPIIAAFYVASIAIGLLCSKPKLAFYLTVALSFATCALLFHLNIPLEMGGIVHTLPFAVVTWMISKLRWKRRHKSRVRRGRRSAKTMSDRLHSTFAIRNMLLAFPAKTAICRQNQSIGWRLITLKSLGCKLSGAQLVSRRIPCSNCDHTNELVLGVWIRIPTQVQNSGAVEQASGGIGEKW